MIMTLGRDEMRNLREILASYYPTNTDARRVVTDAGLRQQAIGFESKSINTWFSILEHAGHSKKISKVVEIALADFPEDETLKTVMQGKVPPILAGPEAKDWHGPTNASQLEKIIGKKSTLVPINYLEIGLLRASSVARVLLPDGSSGTGFLVEGNILITNNHVLPDVDVAASALAQFNYQQTSIGHAAPTDVFELSPQSFFKTSAEDDWTAVQVNGDPTAKWGSLKLSEAHPEVGDHVNIIQHAGGGFKQISFTANVIVFVGGGRVQYLTDTLPGSSGSPVFDTRWRVVALHHSGGWLQEPNAPAGATSYRNEGVAINKLIEGLSA
jgi:V8-like Glu-specific endopeptidase